MLVFNTSANWINNHYMYENNKKSDWSSINKNEIIYTVLDKNKILKDLGIGLMQCMISCDIFHVGTNKVFTVNSIYFFSSKFFNFF